MEWQRQCLLMQGKQLVSIYFGGGTPSLLSPSAVEQLLDTIRKGPVEIAENCEISLEANPENVSISHMQALRSAGINRISLGVQSLDDSSLEILERGHAAKKALDAIDAIHQAGLSNLSIDLMYDLPGQTMASWQRTLDYLAKLPITHLSLYNLTFEPEALFFKRRKQLVPLLPNPEESLAMLEMGIQALEQAGLMRYEISAFAKKGFHSIHNTGYWTARPFLGLGPSAFSYWDQKRFRNISSFHRWKSLLEENKTPVDFEEALPKKEAFNELLAVQLRLLEGIELSIFTERHGPIPLSTQCSIETLCQEGLLECKDSFLRLTTRGRLFYDTVAASII